MKNLTIKDAFKALDDIQEDVVYDRDTLTEDYQRQVAKAQLQETKRRKAIKEAVKKNQLKENKTIVKGKKSLKESLPLKEEVQDEAYEIADYIKEKIQGKDLVTWGEFENLVSEACKELYDVDIFATTDERVPYLSDNKVTINDKTFDIDDFINGDIRGILSYDGWNTTDNGDLTTKDIEEGCKKESKLKEMYEPISSFKDFTFIDKTNQGWEVKKVYRDLDDDRMHIVVYRPKRNDYAVGLGYSPEDGNWNQGRYDFKTLEDAINSLTRDYNVEDYVAKKESCKEGCNKEEGCKGKDCKKQLVEEPIYDLATRHDSRQSFYGKAKVDTGDKGDKNKLYSYNTLVAEIVDGEPRVYGTYSSTTLRHIKEWLLQLGYKAENKNQILKDYGYDRNTGKRFEEKCCEEKCETPKQEEPKKECKENLKEGYIGQTVEDFFNACGEPDMISEFYMANVDDDDYDPDKLTDYNEVIEKYGECDFWEFDTMGSGLTVNIDTTAEYSDGDYYSTLTLDDFIGDCNDDEIAIYDFGADEEVFRGFKDEIPDELLEAVFVSFDAPDMISINYKGEETDDYDDEDIDENCKGAKCNENTKAPKQPTKKLTEAERVDVNNEDEVEKGKEIIKNNQDKNTDDEVLQVVDVNADTIDKLKDDYVGEVILICNECNTPTFRKPEELVRDEDNPDLWNVGEKCTHCGKESNYSLGGQVGTMDAEIDKEDDKDTPTDKPADEPKDDETNDKPMPKKDDEKIEDEFEEEEITFESLNTDKFNSVANSYLTEVYGNVESFETTGAQIDETNNKLIVEGKITYKSGKTKETKFEFLGESIDKDNKLVFKGLNETFSKNDKAFTLTASLVKNILITEGLEYDYSVDRLNESKIVKGKIYTKQ